MEEERGHGWGLSVEVSSLACGFAPLLGMHMRIYSFTPKTYEGRLTNGVETEGTW